MKMISIKTAALVLMFLWILSFAICNHLDLVSQKSTSKSPHAETELSEVSGTNKSDKNSDETEEKNQKDPDINKYREDYNLGTCKNLSGNVSVVLFYVDDFESSWKKEEIDRFTQKEVVPGLAFLEKAAKAYGIELSLDIKETYSSIYYDGEVITSIKNTGLASTNILWQAAQQINYSSTEEMINSFRSIYETEEVVCFTIFNKNGTSYAINPKRDYDYKLDEHCIIFSRDFDSKGKDPDGWHASVIAHETLHLFGAEDFYTSASRKMLAQLYYPNDIMLSCAYNINKNNIGKATAFYIGWIEQMPALLSKEGWQIN